MAGTPTSALIPILVLVLAVGSDLWVYYDAKAQWERGTPVFFSTSFLRLDSPAAWFVACLVVWVIFFPIYVVGRNQAG